MRQDASGVFASVDSRPITPFFYPVHRLNREEMTMGRYIITFRSVTYAQRGEELLRGAGYRCSLGRTPRWMEEQGCGYALRVWCREVEAPVALLRQERIPLRRVYSQEADGSMEVVNL